jgi:uncharacterized NAD(P)/FAD-binding protein YdhS
VTIRPRSGGPIERLDVAGIVNCTGPRETIATTDDPVLAGLVGSGHARLGPAGLGVDTADDGSLLSAAGIPSRVLFTLGSLRKGGLWETTAIPEIRAQASDLAEALVSRVATRQAVGS